MAAQVAEACDWRMADEKGRVADPSIEEIAARQVDLSASVTILRVIEAGSS